MSSNSIQRNWLHMEGVQRSVLMNFPRIQNEDDEDVEEVEPVEHTPLQMESKFSTSLPSLTTSLDTPVVHQHDIDNADVFVVTSPPPNRITIPKSNNNNDRAIYDIRCLAKHRSIKSKTTTDQSKSTRNGLEDFTIEDDVFEEFNSIRGNNDVDEGANILEWRANKMNTGFGWLLECLWLAFSIAALCGVGLSTIAVGITYVNMNVFQGHCNLTIVKFLSSTTNDKRRYQITAEIVQLLFLNLSHLLVMGMVFTFTFIYHRNLFSINIIMAVVDSGYRLYNYFYPKDGWLLQNLPSIIISLAIILLNSSIISRKFYNNQGLIFKKRQVFLVFQLVFQVLFSGLILLATKFIIFPEFERIDASSSYMIIPFYVFVSIFIRSCVRVILLNLSTINHPATSYIFLVFVNASTVTVYRFLQAEVRSLWSFVLISLIISATGFVEKITLIFVDHFFIWMYRKLTMAKDKDNNNKSFVGKYRTPRSQRLVADIIVCAVIHEVTFIGISNAMVQLYRDASTSTISRQFGTRILAAFLCEFVFSIAAVYLLTWIFNIPVLKVWRKKWRKFLLVNLTVVTSVIVAVNLYLLTDWKRIITKQVHSRTDSC